MGKKKSHLKPVPDPTTTVYEERSRMGTFHVSADLFNAKPDIVRTVLRELDFLPYSVVPIDSPPVMEFMGHSPKFEVVRPLEMVPTYQVKIAHTDDGPPVVQIERQEEKRIITPG